MTTTSKPRLAQLSEFADNRGAPLAVDRQQSVIRGVKILGLASKNGREYLPDAVRGALALYEGAKVNVNHPAGRPDQPRGYEDRLGVICDVRFVEGTGLFGDLHFNPKHALAEQLAWDAEHRPENVGLSHNVVGRTASRDGRTVVEAICRVHSVDLVADPATTVGLYESGAPGGESERGEIANCKLEEGNELAALREELDLLRQEKSAAQEQLAAAQDVSAELAALQIEKNAVDAQLAELPPLREELDRLRAEVAQAHQRAATARPISADSHASAARASTERHFIERIRARGS